MRILVACAAAFSLVFAASAVRAAPAGYPTETLADYVLACMASNGETQDALRRCSCSIDYVASQISYDDYVQAETVLRMQQVPSGDPRVGMFRSSPWATQMVEKLRRAQVEAEQHCH